MPAKSLMIQGTTSSAGKTTIVTGLCRLLARRGLKVAPFKPQNMALNSAVTIDGGEIGRAQALQAVACGVSPVVDMNPVLLKPNSNTGAQVIIRGKVWAQMDASTYHREKPRILPLVVESFQRLAADYDVIVIEGAGSPAEINLRDGDVANMGFAEAIDCPVLLAADIDRGGVFAHLSGTLAVLSPSEQTRIKGFIINKFRGDVGLLQPGIAWLEEHCLKPVLGVVPYLQGLSLEGEDSLSRNDSAARVPASNQLRIVVPLLPSLSNDSDFQPLGAHPQVAFSYVRAQQPIPPADLVILPGSKSVFNDLQWLRSNGWETYLRKHLRYGGKVIGICGGFQMLGKRLLDPHGIESAEAVFEGFGLLDIQTELQSVKKLARVSGRLNLPGQPAISGYEIHMGSSSGTALDSPALMLEHGPDGTITSDGQIIGTYLHGLFDTPAAVKALLVWAGLKDAESVDFAKLREQSIDCIADALENHLQMQTIDALLTA